MLSVIQEYNNVQPLAISPVPACFGGIVITNTLSQAQSPDPSGKLESVERQHAKLISVRDELRVTIDKQRAERQELQAKQLLTQTWRKVTFVLLSARTAVGIEAHGSDFTVQAVAHYPDTEYVARLVQKFSIPCITQDDLLTEKLGRLRPGESVPNDVIPQLTKFWCRHKYVPVDRQDAGNFVVFHDMEHNSARLGFLVSVGSDSLTFQSVAQRPEIIRRERIKSGSARTGDAARIKSEPAIDFLDLCVLRVGQQLQSAENTPGFQAVALKIQVDELEEALKLSKQLDNTWQDHWFDYVARTYKVPYVRDQRKEPARVLREFSLGLEDQMRSRLNRLGIPLVEREELDSLVSERDLAKSKHFDERNYGKLHSATHVVMVEVGRPTGDGAFRVDIRLIDTHSGTILFEDTDDIGKPVSTLANTFNVQTGPLMVMTMRTERSVHTPTRQKPLWLGSLDSTPSPTRLVRLESSNSTEHVYYDLFDRTRHVVPAGAANMVAPAAGKMPRDEKLRWMAWQISNSVLPTAGKVTMINGERVTFNIGSSQGIVRGDVFQVMRGASADTESFASSIMPVEIRADEVSSQHSSGVVLTSEVSKLWNELRVSEGDLVLRRGSSDATVQLVSPVTDFRHWPADVTRRVNGWGPNQLMRLKQKLSTFGKSWVDRTTTGLQQVGVSTASEGESNGSRITHQVHSFVAPLSPNTECSQFSVRFEIKDAASGKLLQSVGPISLAESEVFDWRP